MSNPQVSIIIVLYNSAEYLQPCLNSLRDQSFRDFEVIVYDNASTDNTLKLLRKEYLDVKLIESEENIGFAAANNRAASLAQGEFLAFINPDTIVEPNWLAPLLDILESDSTVGAVTPAIVFADQPHLINTCGNETHLSGITYCRDFGKPISDDRAREVSSISGAAFVIHKKLFTEVGGFEDKFFMYFEDTDLSLKLRSLGWRCMAMPQSKVLHAYKPVFHPQKIFYLERNRYLSLFSLMSWSILLLMLPALMFGEAMAWGYCLARGKQALRAKGRAWLDVIKNLSWIRQRRKLFVQPCTDQMFMLQTFRPDLKIHYVSSSNIVTSIIEKIGWLTSGPFLGIVRKFAR